MEISLLQQIFFPQHNGCCLCSRSIAEGIVCSRCLQEFENFRLAHGGILRRKGTPLSIAVWKHEGPVRLIIHQMKYHQNRGAAAFLGREMAQTLREKRRETGPIDLVIPVPMHPLREKKRGYNQALLLARHVCAGNELAPDLLVRLKHTGTQVSRTKQERMEAMENAFGVIDASAVAGRRILLVDDVLTTGATASACAMTLYGAGAAEVLVLTAARAVEKESAVRIHAQGGVDRGWGGML